ncbi:hypothetical protein SRIMM317S_00113 [Streptomyces rimosus subsp. rimosus]
MRTSGPLRPSGRRLASTGQIVPSAVTSEHTRIIRPASRVAAWRALGSSVPSRASATKMTSTSET